jgi:hypothetical protein
MDEKELERKTVSADDIATVIAHIVHLNNTPESGRRYRPPRITPRPIRRRTSRAEAPPRYDPDEAKHPGQDVDRRARCHSSGVSFVFIHDRSRPASRNFSPPTSSRSSCSRKTCFLRSKTSDSSRPLVPEVFPRARRLRSPRRSPVSLRPTLSDPHS